MVEAEQDVEDLLGDDIQEAPVVDEQAALQYALENVPTLVGYLRESSCVSFTLEDEVPAEVREWFVSFLGFAEDEPLIGDPLLAHALELAQQRDEEGELEAIEEEKAQAEVYETDPKVIFARDQALIIRSQHGDAEAWGELMRLYARYIVKNVNKYLTDEEEAMDAVQDISLKAYTKIHLFNIQMKFVPWMNTVIRNHCFNLIKKHSNSSVFYVGSISEENLNEMSPSGGTRGKIFYNLTDPNSRSPRELAERAEQKQLINRCLEKMTPNHAEIIRLRVYHNLSYKEMAECLNIPIGTVMSRLHNAIKEMRRLYKRFDSAS